MNLPELASKLQSALVGKSLDLVAAAQNIEPLSQLLALLPAELQTIDKAEIAFEEERAVTITGGASSLQWQIVPQIVATGIEISISITQGENNGFAFGGTINAKANIAGVDTELTAILDDMLALTGTVTDLPLSELTAHFLDAVALPSNLPNIQVSNLTVSVTPKTGAFSLHAGSAQEWDFGLGGFIIEHTALTIERTVDASTMPSTSLIHGAMELTCRGPVVIADGASLDSLQLTIDFVQAGDWTIAGTLGATLFAQPMTFSLTVTHGETNTYDFLWTANPALALITVGDSTSMAVSEVHLAITRALGETGVATTDWVFSGSGEISLGDTFHSLGRLEVYATQEQKGIAFIAEDAKLSVDLPLSAEAGSEAIGFDIKPERIAILKENVVEGWFFEAESALVIRGLSGTADKLVPDEMAVTLRADRQSLRVTATPLIDTLSWSLPDLTLAGETFTLGEAGFGVTNFSIILSATPAVSAEMWFDLPKSINLIFGSENGEPTTELLETHIGLKGSMNLTSGLSLQMLTPIIAGEEHEVDGVIWVHLDFGDFGAIRYIPPIISYSSTTGDFRASGGFEQLRQLKLPLTFVQKLLEGAGAGDLAHLIPNALPLTEFKVLTNNQLDTQAFVSRLQTISDKANLNFPISTIAPMLNIIGERFNRLPDDFRSYLEFELPDSFQFSIAVTPGAGFGLKFDIRAGEDKPIRFIYPTLFGILPALMGITLRHIGLGEVLSGNLLLAEIDVEMDIFDLPTLVAVLALPTEYLTFLPDSTTIHRKFTIRDLFMIIVYQTIIPIPIPIFYDDLGIDILGLEGLGLGLKWQFPKPTGGLGDLIPLFSDMKPFFTDKDARLPADIFDRHNFGLNFSIAPAYIKTPKYVGDKLLGKHEEVLRLALSEGLARMLNALKTGSLAYILPIIPLEFRLGSSGVQFGSISLEAAWAVTTSEEFKTNLLTDHSSAVLFLDKLRRLSPDDQQAMLTLMTLGTAQSTTDAPGVLIFFLGDWVIDGLLAINVRMGMEQSPRGGFGFGFIFRGEIGSFLDFEARGLAVFDSNVLTSSTQLSAQQTQQIEAANERIQMLEESVPQMEASLAALQADLNRTQQQIAQNQFQINQLTSEIAVLESIPSFNPADKRRQSAQKRQQIVNLENQSAQLYDQVNGIQQRFARLNGQCETTKAQIIAASSQIREINKNAQQMVVKQASPFSIQGHSHLRILDHEVFHGDVQIDQNQLYLDGAIALFPDTWPISVNGNGRLVIHSEGDIYFHSDVNISLLNFVLVGSNITITNHRVEVSGTWLGASASFIIIIEQNNFLLSGSVGYDLALDFAVGPLVESHTGLVVVDRLAINATFDAALHIRLGSSGFYADVAGSFVWNHQTITLPSFSISISPASIESLVQNIIAEIQRVANDLFNTVFRSIKEWLQAGVDGLVNLTAQLLPALEAARKWSQAAWDATSQWSVNAWQSAYQWSDKAWAATSQWSDDAWHATTQWSDDAWAATTKWTDAAWDATTHWGKDAWDATTKWGADTWRESETWTNTIWQASSGWTVDQWNNLKDTLDKIFKLPHGDVTLIPHIDTNFIPHGDISLIPHGDISFNTHGDVAIIPHGDVQFNAHGDISLIPHGDVRFNAHGDFAFVPHGDLGFAAHLDTSIIPHIDTPSTGHIDFPAVLHGDIGHGDGSFIGIHGDIPHWDTPRSGHGDVGAIFHGDTSFVPHGDSPGRAHIDTAQAAHIDTPQIAHIDTPQTAHIDTPQTAHIDTAQAAHIDTPQQLHADTPQTTHIDTPQQLHGDVPQQAHIDTN